MTKILKTLDRAAAHLAALCSLPTVAALGAAASTIEAVSHATNSSMVKSLHLGCQASSSLLAKSVGAMLKYGYFGCMVAPESRIESARAGAAFIADISEMSGEERANLLELSTRTAKAKIGQEPLLRETLKQSLKDVGALIFQDHVPDALAKLGVESMPERSQRLEALLQNASSN